MIKEIGNDEVLEISLKLEQEGARFYNELARYIADPEIKDFLLHMAKEEGKHEQQFKRLLSEKAEKPFGWEKDEKFRHLIDNIYQTDIFPKLDEVFKMAPKFEAIRKALDFAIEAECVSAEFYALMGETCENFEAKTALLILEKEELGHLAYVESLKEKYLG